MRGLGWFLAAYGLLGRPRTELELDRRLRPGNDGGVRHQRLVGWLGRTPSNVCSVAPTEPNARGEAGLGSQRLGIAVVRSERRVSVRGAAFRLGQVQAEAAHLIHLGAEAQEEPRTAKSRLQLLGLDRGLGAGNGKLAALVIQ